MNQKSQGLSQQNSHFLAKTSSTRSCENLLCLTKRCNEDEAKQKQRILNNQYFQKLSLKKFNNSTFINQSFYEKDKGHERSLRRDKSTEDDEFQNIVINSHTQEQAKYSVGNVNQAKNYQQYGQFEETRRIARSSSYRQLEKPQLKSTDRSISRQLQLDYRKIQDLQKLRNRLQTQIRQLDQSIDKYYYVYHSKLEELKKIQSKMKEIDEDQRTLRRIPLDDDSKSFKKKSFWEEFNGSKHRPNQKKDLITDDKLNNREFSYKTNQLNFGQTGNVCFVKKAI